MIRSRRRDGSTVRDASRRFAKYQIKITRKTPNNAMRFRCPRRTTSKPRKKLPSAIGPSKTLIDRPGPSDYSHSTGVCQAAKNGAFVPAVCGDQGSRARKGSGRQITVSAVRPWRTALQRDTCLPSSVFGPVLFSALRRLASICLYEVIGNCFPNWLRFTDGLICCPSQQWDAHVQYSPRLTAMDASSAIARGR